MYKQKRNPFPVTSCGRRRNFMTSPLDQKKYGESRGEGHKSGVRFRYDPADKKNFQALNQKTKDSLQGEAYKYDKPFFSPKYGVNVDPEDGVLSNRPIYSDDTKLTYDKIDKPFDNSPAKIVGNFEAHKKHVESKNPNAAYVMGSYTQHVKHNHPHSKKS